MLNPIEQQLNSLLNTEELYLVDPKEVLKRLTGRDCVSYILNYGEE